MSLDLTQHPPRSPRVRLGGYVILPRLLDKGRALVAGKAGQYKYACPLDAQFLEFVGVDSEALKAELATGKGDGEILKWVSAQARHSRTPFEIEAWSAFQERRGPDNLESREFFNGVHREVAPMRQDIATWFDLLDLDDFASFGGKV